MAGNSNSNESLPGLPEDKGVGMTEEESRAKPRPRRLTPTQIQFSRSTSNIRRLRHLSVTSPGDEFQDPQKEGLQQQILKLKRIFNEMDTDGKGSVSPEQLMTALSTIGFGITKGEVLQLMETLDTNNNHAMDYEEFLAATLRLQIAEHNDVLVQVFKTFDEGETGKITLEQLKHCLGVESAEDEASLNDFLAHVSVEEDNQIDYLDFLHVFSRDCI